MMNYSKLPEIGSYALAFGMGLFAVAVTIYEVNRVIQDRKDRVTNRDVADVRIILDIPQDEMMRAFGARVPSREIGYRRSRLTDDSMD